MKTLIEDWWSGCEREALMFRSCPACGSRTFQLRLHCPNCSAEMTWSESLRQGTVESATRVHKSSATAAGIGPPYTIGYVKMDEGFSMLSTFTEAVEIGDRVKIVFVRVGKRMVPVSKR
jgi:uncharacterized OB-fold protein